MACSLLSAGFCLRAENFRPQLGECVSEMNDQLELHPCRNHTTTRGYPTFVVSGLRYFPLAPLGLAAGGTDWMELDATPGVCMGTVTLWAWGCSHKLRASRH